MAYKALWDDKRDMARVCIIGFNFHCDGGNYGQTIKDDKDIRGIMIGKREVKMSQYTDDTTLIMKSKSDLRRALGAINNFGDVSG